MKQHIKRKSESNHKPKLVEYLQGGILFHFAITEVQREEMLVFEYVEFWFDLNEPNIEQIVNENGFELTEEHRQWLQ